MTRGVLARQYYAGGTTISAATLLLGIGGTTGNIIGDVAGNGALAFGRHAALALGVWASITCAAAMPAEPARGEKRARHWCASCHIVANDQKGGADSAPPFATIARKPGFDGGKIAQFLMDPHPKMPDMQLSRDEAKDLGAYIASLAQWDSLASCRIGYRGIQQRFGRALHSLLYLHSRGLRPVYCAPIMVQWRNWTKRVQWRGPYFRSDEILCVRSANPLIVHDFETESLALFQAGHFCAFDGTYIDQHINATVVRLDETIALRDIEPSYDSSSHSASSHE